MAVVQAEKFILYPSILLLFLKFFKELFAKADLPVPELPVIYTFLKLSKWIPIKLLIFKVSTVGTNKSQKEELASKTKG